MISGPNSPFYKALIEPKIGTDFSSVVGCVHGCHTCWRQNWSVTYVNSTVWNVSLQV